MKFSAPESMMLARSESKNQPKCPQLAGAWTGKTRETTIAAGSVSISNRKQASPSARPICIACMLTGLSSDMAILPSITSIEMFWSILLK